MYQISVEQHFDAAHFLRGYHGKCEALHGHRFRVVVKVKSSGVNDIGIAYDFTDLKHHLGDILVRFATPQTISLLSLVGAAEPIIRAVRSLFSAVIGK